jgi:hypothetical protein
MKYRESIADNLSKAGWNCGSISSTDHQGRRFWVVAAEREDAGRFIVHADEELTAFPELEAATRAGSIRKMTCHHSRYHRKRSHL